MSTSKNEELKTVYFIDATSVADGAGETKREVSLSAKTFAEFKKQIAAQLWNGSYRDCVICTSDREVVDASSFKNVNAEDTLLLLKKRDQELVSQFTEKINYEPHYQTLTQSGLYEYYASNNCKPLPYALSELIDNALGATNSESKRVIELRFFLDEEKPQNSCIIVYDNGKGMRSRELADWASYKKSEAVRKKREFGSSQPSTPKRDPKEYPRFMNSQISKFGAGGKQAVFFIGNTVLMVTKSKPALDVHELCLSKQKFEGKEQRKDRIYEDSIKTRKVGDASHITDKTLFGDILRSTISEEKGQKSFTYVFISDIHIDHIKHIKHDIDSITFPLAHIYHYYLHGPNGNKIKVDAKKIPAICKNLEITVKTFNLKSSQSSGNSRRSTNGSTNILSNGVNMTEPCKIVKLRDITEDMQTKYIRSSTSTFEFKAIVDDLKEVEGVIRYHPFLYDKETYPEDWYAIDKKQNKDDAEDIDSKPVPHNRPIFECYWNGRLIPNAAVKSLEWCSQSKKNSNVPPECFQRISGVLWTNECFEVTQNKLTFQDSLETKLKDPKVAYTFFSSGQYRRGIEDGFKNWILECHNQFDKEIKFVKFRELFTEKNEKGKSGVRQVFWSAFDGIVFGEHEFKKGQLVKTTKTNPIFVGRIVKFILKSEVDLPLGGDIFGTSGYFEIKREPEAYGETKIYPIKNLDLMATQTQIEAMLSKDADKLPADLKIEWPKTDPIEDGAKIKAGTAVGPIRVEVLDNANQLVKGYLPGSVKKQILVSLQLERHDTGLQPVQVHYLNCPYSSQWNYWFKEINSSVFSKNLGKYMLILQAYVQSDKGVETKIGDKTLPMKKIYFKVVEGDPCKFSLKGELMVSQQRIGVPFNIPLVLFDKWGNNVKVDQHYKVELKCDQKDYTITYEDSFGKENLLMLKKVVVIGMLPNEIKGKEVTVSIKLPEISKEWVTTRIVFKPGTPSKLEVFPKEDVVIENGTLPQFGALLYDCSDNQVTHLVEDKLAISVNFFHQNENGEIGDAIRGQYVLDFVTGPDGKLCSLKGSPSAIQLQGLTKNENSKVIVAKFSLKGHSVEEVTKNVKVVASSKPTTIKMFCTSEFTDLVVEMTSCVEWTAGSTIKNIHFKIFDDLGNEIIKPNLSKENVKVSWASKVEVGKADLKNGYLPNIRVSTTTEQVTYYNVSLICAKDSVSGKGGVLEYGFNINPRPGEMSQLKVTLPPLKKVPAGEAMAHDVEIKVADKYGNGVSGITELSCLKLKVSCDSSDIDETTIEKVLGEKEGVIVVKKLKFVATNLSLRNVQFTYENLKEVIVLETVPGPPKKLRWEFNTQWEGKIISVHKNGYLNIALQLYDAFDNKCVNQSLQMMLGIDKSLELDPTGHCVTSNDDGKVDFGMKCIGVKDHIEPKECPFGLCRTCCYGKFQLLVKEASGKVQSPYVNLHVLCDKTKAVKFAIRCSGELECVAGSEFPYFEVKMLAEDESVIEGLSKDYLSMNVTKQGSGRGNALTFVPTNVEEGRFIFEVPQCQSFTVAGKYAVQFHFVDPSNIAGRPLKSEEVIVHVVPDKPNLFAPRDQPTSRCYVSNTSDVHTRVIIKKLKFVLFDRFENEIPCDEDDEKYKGVLVADITEDKTSGGTSNDADDNEIPLFDGGLSSLKFDIIGGTATVKDVILAENTKGKDNREYMLRFQPKFNDMVVESYAHKFTFMNDVQQQLQMVVLEQQKEKLRNEMNNKQEEISLHKKTAEEANLSFNNSRNSERIAIQKLRESGCSQNDIQRLTSLEAIRSLIDAKSNHKAELIRNDEVRRNSVSGTQKSNEAPREPDIVGKILHLAEVDDPQEARVLSWHMQGDMDVIVTTTASKAQELNRRFRGNQQLMAVESIYRGNQPADWNGLLPHQRIAALRSSFVPTGNPVFARTLFRFKRDSSSCKLVFGSLLGDTIVIDTMNDALTYRNKVVRHMGCPTILTRDGERLKSNAKFGGQGNRIPPKLRFVFGLAENSEITQITEQINHLNNLLTVVGERLQLEKKREEVDANTSRILKGLHADYDKMMKDFTDLESKHRQMINSRKQQEMNRKKRNADVNVDSLRNSYDKRRRV